MKRRASRRASRGARNGMRLSLTPVLPEAILVGAVSAEAVRKRNLWSVMLGRPGSAADLSAV
jgi:hypothetical protein